MMTSLDDLGKAQPARRHHLAIVLGYAVLVAAIGGALMVMRAPVALVPLLSIPIILAAIEYPRSVYLPMWFLLVVAVGITLQQLSGGLLIPLSVAVVGCGTVLVLAELLRALNIGRQQATTVAEQRERELAAFNAVTTTITSTLELDQVLQRLVNTVGELFPQALTATIQHMDEAQGALTTVAASAGTEPAGNKLVFRSGQGIAGLAAASNQRVNVPDVKTHPHYIQGNLPPSYRSLLVTPICIGETIWGTLSVAARSVNAFSERDEQLIEQLAQQAGIAIEHARLFDRLRKAEAQYRALFNNNADPLAVFNADRVLLDANAAASRILGLGRAGEPGARTPRVDPEHEQLLWTSIKEALAGKVVRYEFNTEIDGRVRHFEARWERVSYSDGPALQWTAHDITDRRELDHWREELTDIVVHNLRNPLTWVKSGVGMIQILLPQEDKALDPDILTALDKANRGIDKVEQQIDVLLNIGRAEAGQELTGREPTPLDAVITEVTELLAPRAASRGVRIHLDIPERLPFVLGNRNMLSWTLQNLVENAIKYSPRGETVRLTAGTAFQPPGTTPAANGAAPGAERETVPNVLRIAVIDRGPGVPSPDRQRIFQKFYRAPRAEGAQGSGLGLYFCKLAVEAHGGRIWVENGPDGIGSKFSFTLPVPCEPASDMR